MFADPPQAANPNTIADADSDGAEDRAQLELIDRILKKGFRWLRFPAELERRFIEHYVREWQHHELYSALMALLLYDSFLYIDARMIPDIFDLAVFVRVGIVSPLMLFGAWIHWRRYPVKFRQLYMAIVSVLCAGSLIVFTIKTHSPNATYYMFGILPIIVYTNAVQRIPFWSALTASTLTITATVIGAVYIEVSAPMGVVTFAQITVVTILLTMIASYRLEHDLRDRYLLHLRDELLRKRELRLMAELGRANEQLLRLSETDVLTGVANRRSFENQLSALSQQAQQTQQPLSLLLLDVDHFKLYNDHYGHPAGDRCLHEVAMAVQSALRSPGDRFARYGGEEFVAILPNTNADEALTIAERVRRAVVDCALPHEQSAVARCVTISIGVATLHAEFSDNTTERLLKTADQMLYQAKLTGRNRVWPSPARGINSPTAAATGLNSAPPPRAQRA